MEDFFVHESSFIDDNVLIGKGTKIWHFCHVQSGAVIGERCSMGQNVNIGNNVKIGNGVRIQNNVSVYEGVELEDNVFCGPSCVFILSGPCPRPEPLRQHPHPGDHEDGLRRQRHRHADRPAGRPRQGSAADAAYPRRAL